MCKLVIAGLVGAFFGVVLTASAMNDAKATIKLGVGGLYNDRAVNEKSKGGGHISVDVNVPGGKRIAFSPVVEVYRKSGVTSAWAGVSFLINLIPDREGGERNCTNI